MLSKNKFEKVRFSCHILVKTLKISVTLSYKAVSYNGLGLIVTHNMCGPHYTILTVAVAALCKNGTAS